MANAQHVDIVREGPAAADAWRARNGRTPLDLAGADLAGMNLRLVNAWDDKAHAAFYGANFRGTNLEGTIFRGQNLGATDLRSANLSHADLSETYLYRADLGGATLTGTIFTKARFTGTVFANVDLSTSTDLDTASYEGPCVLSIDTLRNFVGRITPVTERFLRGCGLAPWEVEIARLYDKALTAAEISEIVSVGVFGKRTDGPLFIGGVFVSYSHADATFVDRLYDRLYRAGASVWLDRHDLVAGDLHSQVQRQIRLRDVVIIVLSEASMGSDWVEHELRWARAREKDENRAVLCPIALDEAWKRKCDDVLWVQVTKKAVLDFSRPDDFDRQMARLIDGIKVNYGRAR